MRRLVKFAFVAMVLAMTVSMRADSVFLIDVASVSSTVNTGQTSSMGNTVQIAPNMAWANALGSSSWVSFANTGDPNSPGYRQVSNSTVVSFFDHFYMPGTATSGWLEVMADDSTSVILNGVTLVFEAPTTNNYYQACSDTVIGCRGGYRIDLPVSLLKTGDNVLEFQVAQRAGSSFGLDYYGQIVDPVAEPVPEPAALSLWGIGMAVMLGLRKKLRN